MLVDEVEGLVKILNTWDLDTATAGSVRRHLEKEFKADLSDFIRKEIDIFFEEEEEDENEGKGRRRERKRKAPELCKVSTQLQEFIGGGPKMIRTEVVKKIVAYVREKDLQLPHCKEEILADDKLEALFPILRYTRYINLFQINNFLLEHNHIRPLEAIDMQILLVEILSTWDLDTATAGRVRQHLEKDFGADLSDPKCRTIQEQIDILFEEGEEDEIEGTRRGRKRKRKVPELCRVSSQLQNFVGGGPKMARMEAVKKIVAYGRKKGLLKNEFIFADDKLEALFPGIGAIDIYQINNLLSKHHHTPPPKVVKRSKGDYGVRKRNNEAVNRRSENCKGDQVWVKRKMKNIQPNINLALAEEDMRPWDNMPRDILVKIFKLLPFPYWVFDPCYVCRSWKLAVADVMFPSDELDLRVLDSYPWKYRQRSFFLYLRIALNSRPDIPWTTLYLPNKTALIKNEVPTWIAEKTPELRNLYVPKELKEDIFLKSVIPYWKNLRKVHIDISSNNFSDLQANCKYISELSLYGWMDEHLASMLAKFFPNLKSLEIDGCTMSNHVLRIIMDGHKNLELLDTGRNFYCFAEAHMHVATRDVRDEQVTNQKK